MKKIEYFTINLEKTDPIYFAGETLTGKVNIRILDRLKINSLKMLLEGVSKVDWYINLGNLCAPKVIILGVA